MMAPDGPRARGANAKRPARVVVPMIEPFSVAVPKETLDDLRDRLRRVRWPSGVTDSGGLPLGDIRELIRYWGDEFDWEQQQAQINRWRHFRASGIHFIHEAAADSHVAPLR